MKLTTITIVAIAFAFVITIAASVISTGLSNASSNRHPDSQSAARYLIPWATFKNRTVATTWATTDARNHGAVAHYFHAVSK